MNFYVLIPAYKPDGGMVPFICDLLKQTSSIVVVDDGGGANFATVFQSLKELGVTVLHHEKNCGKGAALRTGIAYISANYPECQGIITADCDGQHTVKDIMRVAVALEQNPQKLIVGGRALRENVPLRSRFGNSAMRNLYRFASGYKLRDTQTGLRGIPCCLFDKLLKLAGDRYEYEMNMLLNLKQWNVQPHEIQIETIYINNNEGSHFNTLKDSSRIMGHIFLFLFKRMLSFFKFIASSLISYLFEYGVFQLLLLFVPSFSISLLSYELVVSAVLLCNIIARIFSSVLNYIINRKLVFKNKGRHSVIKYYMLVIVVMLLSSLAISGLSDLLSLTGLSASASASIVKPIVDAAFFIINYFVQRSLVFNDKGRKSSRE